MSVTDTAENKLPVRTSTTATLLMPSVLIWSMASRMVSFEDRATTGLGVARYGRTGSSASGVEKTARMEA